MKSDIEKMRKLRNLGYTFLDIAKNLKISETTVRYHLNPVYKEIVKRSSKARRQTPEGKEQQNKYYKKRYKTDKEFRERHIERSKRYQREHPEQYKQYKKEYGERTKEEGSQKKSKWHDIGIILMMLVAFLLVMIVGILICYRWFVWGI
jgi:DNA-binding transcriptional ArsR family regulator